MGAIQLRASCKKSFKPINPPSVRQHIAILLQNTGKTHRGTRRLPAWRPPAQCPRTRSPTHGGVLRDQDANTQSPPSLWPGQASKLTSAILKAKKGSFLIKVRTFTSRDLDPTSATDFLGANGISSPWCFPPTPSFRSKAQWMIWVSGKKHRRAPLPSVFVTEISMPLTARFNKRYGIWNFKQFGNVCCSCCRNTTNTASKRKC